MRPFVSLHSHTTGSIGDSTISPKELVDAIKEAGQTAVAVTDHGSCAALWDTYKAAKKSDIKLIAGCEIYFVENSTNNEDTTLRHLVLLAKTATGYKNLLTLNKRGFDNYTIAFKRAIPRIDWNMLEELHDGLICTSACGCGVIGQYIMTDQLGAARNAAKRLQSIFGDDFALELQPHMLQRRQSAYSGAINQQKINMELRKIGHELDIRCIVATDAHYVKQDAHDEHDVYTCINSGQPKSSGSRLIYDKSEFYVKNSDQVYEHFVRHISYWGEEFINSLFENTIYFSDKCESPDWIDPSVSTGEKSQLPDFPYRDEPDIKEFEAWKCSGKLADSNIEEDAQFYRYRSEIGLEQKIQEGKIPEEDRDESYASMREEFDVLEYRKFSSYMLITAEFLGWCRKNGVPIGPGRGCLTGDTLVLTSNGYVRLDEITIGTEVFSHNGIKRVVKDIFKYDISEIGLSITSNHSFNNINLTRDHKVFACKAQETEKYQRNIDSRQSIKRWEAPESPKWIPASELVINDLIFMPFPIRNKREWSCVFDLNEFNNYYEVTQNNTIVQKIPKSNDLSIRDICKSTGLSRGAVQNAKRGRKIINSTRQRLIAYLSKFELSFDEWRIDENIYKKEVCRYINCDNELLYVVGRWIGDGWTEYDIDKGWMTGFAFNSSDDIGIDRISNYFSNLGFDIKRYDSKSGKRLVQITIKGKLLYDLFRSFVPDYKQTSCSKHLPWFFRDLDDEQLRCVLRGLFDSDGYIEISKDYKRENFDTTSLRLALEVKESLLYLKIPSSINTRNEFFRGKYLCKKSYKLRFKGLHFDKSSSNLIFENGYYCKITAIEDIPLYCVYDISVDDDKSYITANYAVHNSVGGSLTAYCNSIHQAYPKRYGLIFARFLNKYKEAFPDIDNDIAPSGRDRLYNYLCEKYGTENVCHVSNINTITPKVYARDISRVFEFGGQGRTVAVEIGNNIADSLPAEVHTIKQALEEAPLFAEYAKQYPELIKYANLCGKPRAWSTHAGGIIISKRPLTGLVPLRRDTAGALVLEYDKERAEENGLVKIDILGLETLDIIGQTYKLIKENGKEIPDQFNYEIDDTASYNLVGEGDTFGVFQLGSTAVHVCKKVKPKNVADIALISALVRPAAKDTIPSLLKVRNGDEEMSLMHNSLHRAFAGTYGFGLYEESLMYLAQDVAGWDLHDADKLRKLTKEKGKNPEKVKKWRAEFIEGAVKNRRIPEEIATKVWDDVINLFQGYGFNRSVTEDESVDIYTSEGNFISSKPIKDVLPGEFVRSRDEATGKEIFVEVVANHDHGELDVFEVALNTGETTRCSMNHKFRVQETNEMLPLWKIIEMNYSIVLG